MGQDIVQAAKRGPSVVIGEAHLDLFVIHAPDYEPSGCFAQKLTITASLRNCFRVSAVELIHVAPETS